MAKLYGQTFSRAGVAVISGMAMGVDGCAHRGALSGSGGTYAVVGCGVDVCYPRSNYRLYNEIAENGGIISEYPPGTRVSPGHFPMRNRIIMGMSLAVVVVEARNKSGSLITAQLAADAGREVFVVPGHITDSLFEGGRQLALSGAQMTAGPESIMDYFDILEPKFNISLENLNNLLETTDKIVYANLRCEPKHIDEIIQSSGLPATQVMKSLISLECRNLCKQVVQNYYVKIVV